MWRHHTSQRRNLDFENAQHGFHPAKAEAPARLGLTPNPDYESLQTESVNSDGLFGVRVTKKASVVIKQVRRAGATALPPSTSIRHFLQKKFFTVPASLAKLVKYCYMLTLASNQQ